MPSITNVKSLFNEVIPKALKENPEKVKELRGVYLFKISGTDGGTWTVNLSSVPPSCEKVISMKPDCIIETSDENLLEITKNPAKAMSLLFEKKLKISGDLSLIAKFTKLFE